MLLFSPSSFFRSYRLRGVIDFCLLRRICIHKKLIAKNVMAVCFPDANHYKPVKRCDYEKASRERNFVRTKIRGHFLDQITRLRKHIPQPTSLYFNIPNCLV